MKVQIIGLGVVGKATAAVLSRLGYDYVGKDKGDVLERCHIAFICTPENVVASVVQNLMAKDCILSDGVIVIRSAVEPGICGSLARTYRTHIMSNPEFLREAVALSDAWLANYILLGECCRYHGDMLQDIYKPLGVPIVRCNSKTAETVKYAHNNFMSTLVTYWNQIALICQKVEVNPNIVARIATHDPRIPQYGTLITGEGLTGRCLPKDLDHMIEFCQKIGVEPTLFDAIKKVDERIKHGQ